MVEDQSDVCEAFRLLAYSTPTSCSCSTIKCLCGAGFLTGQAHCGPAGRVGSTEQHRGALDGTLQQGQVGNFPRRDATKTRKNKHRQSRLRCVGQASSPETLRLIYFNFILRPTQGSKAADDLISNAPVIEGAVCWMETQPLGVF